MDILNLFTKKTKLRVFATQELFGTECQRSAASFYGCGGLNVISHTTCLTSMDQG